MVRFVLSQLKPSELYILSFEKGLGLWFWPFLKNVELLGLYPILSAGWADRGVSEMKIIVLID